MWVSSSLIPFMTFMQYLSAMPGGVSTPRETFCCSRSKPEGPEAVGRFWFFTRFFTSYNYGFWVGGPIMCLSFVVKVVTLG